MDRDERVRCLIGHALNDHGHTDFERNESIGNHILANLKEAGFLADERAALTSPVPAGGEATPNETTLITIIADIREKSGVGSKPMLSELADAIAERITPPPSPDVAWMIENLRKLADRAPLIIHERDWLDKAATLLESLSAKKGKTREAVIEECARVADVYAEEVGRSRYAAFEIAERIRALTPKEKA